MKLRLYSICGFLLLIFAACQDLSPEDYSKRISYFENINTGNTYHPDSTLACVTFNIHLGFRANKDPWDKDQSGAGQDQVKNIASVLKRANADFIGLQEVPWNRYNAEIEDFLKALAEEMDMNYAFGGNGFNDPYGIEPVRGQWGNAVLSKYPIRDIENFEVEYKDVWERRSLLDATVQANDSFDVHILSTHHLPSKQGIPNTAQYVGQIDEVVILMGDFNYIGPIENFMDAGLAEADSLNMQHGIDRIFYSSSEFWVEEIGTLPDPDQSSDHPANYCILQRRK